ncbi:hypothetical protein NPIL_615091 [Nephila pilipes]|uniref:Uncharacterized protein n=1 Tax=Nephila pilipes TaxID=299642 RepID=A0A8X6QAB1_NEPPI|nr:hypothetical protein NPIL_615091 [Nephila pilipes]
MISFNQDVLLHPLPFSHRLAPVGAAIVCVIAGQSPKRRHSGDEWLPHPQRAFIFNAKYRRGHTRANSLTLWGMKSKSEDTKNIKIKRRGSPAG